jgi:hypothetical protein
MLKGYFEMRLYILNKTKIVLVIYFISFSVISCRTESFVKKGSLEAEKILNAYVKCIDLSLDKKAYFKLTSDKFKLTTSFSDFKRFNKIKKDFYGKIRKKVRVAAYIKTSSSFSIGLKKNFLDAYRSKFVVYGMKDTVLETIDLEKTNKGMRISSHNVKTLSKNYKDVEPVNFQKDMHFTKQEIQEINEFVEDYIRGKIKVE